jgi:uncharacterized protein YndB with AHSA1/START domain
MKTTPILTALAIGFAVPTIAEAEIVTATDDHFTLKLEANSELSPEQVWERLIVPSEWWQSPHSYSGDAANLSLDPTPGGLWREDWEGGSVWHGTVLQAQPPKVLSLSAPFGPLQGMAVTSVWTITLEPIESGGTTIRFDHVTNGSSASNLSEIAPAVDFVKSEALKALARPLDE